MEAASPAIQSTQPVTVIFFIMLSIHSVPVRFVFLMDILHLFGPKDYTMPLSFRKRDRQVFSGSLSNNFMFILMKEGTSF